MKWNIFDEIKAPEHWLEQAKALEGRKAPPKRLWPRMTKAALAAACVCFLVVGTAFAAGGIIKQYVHSIIVVDNYEQIVPEKSENGGPTSVAITTPNTNIERHTPDEIQTQEIEDIQSAWDYWKSMPDGATELTTETIGTIQCIILTRSDHNTDEKYWGNDLDSLLKAAGVFSMDNTVLEETYSPVPGTFLLTVTRGSDQSVMKAGMSGMYQTDDDGWFTFEYIYWPEVTFGSSYALERNYDKVGLYTRSDGIEVSYQIKDFTFWGDCGTQITQFSFYGQNIEESALMTLFEVFDLSGVIT